MAGSSRWSPWVRRIPLAAVLAVALGWVPYQVYGQSGLSRLLRMRSELAALRADNRALRAETRALRAELALHDDDDLGAVERIARDELGLVKPGEIVFKVEGVP
jgi:cell division protein FtsB